MKDALALTARNPATPDGERVAAYLGTNSLRLTLTNRSGRALPLTPADTVPAEAGLCRPRHGDVREDVPRQRQSCRRRVAVQVVGVSIANAGAQ
jgi:hypothetical protein